VVSDKTESTYVRNGKAMATAAAKKRTAAKGAAKPPPPEPPTPLAPFLRGDAEGRATLPKKPPGMGGAKP
jgi:hypothetical protein